MNEAMRLIEMSKDSLNHTEERTGRLVYNVFPIIFHYIGNSDDYMKMTVCLLHFLLIF